MDKKLLQAAIAAACTLGLAGGAFAQAVPAGTASFDGGNCTAKFVRSSSGIVNETERVCGVDGFVTQFGAPVRLQFRPLTPKFPPNPKCDPKGLLTSFAPWSNYEASIAPWFMTGPTYTYNVCVYYENPVIASGTIDSADADGTDSSAVFIAGKYDVCVNGTYSNDGINVADAKYISTDAWATYADHIGDLLLEWGPSGTNLGAGFGEVQINNAFVNWGAYNTAHQYCTTMSLAAGQSLNLGVFDGFGLTNVKEGGWYGDNSGSLTYTITYVGQ